MDVLKAHGYRIPEDIVVTGFDGCADCQLYNPTLTTVRRGFYAAGERAVTIMESIWAGEPCPEYVYVDSDLIKNHSCGCPEEEKEYRGFYESKYGGDETYKNFNKYLTNMNIAFDSVKDVSNLYDCTISGARLFSFKKMFLCICTGIEDKSVEIEVEEEETDSRPYGLTERMITKVAYGSDVPTGTVFQTKQYVPENLAESEEPYFYCFSPLYFQDTYLGYVAYEPTKIEGMGEIFGTWSRIVSSSAGSFYMKNELSSVVSQLAELYIRDPLTGLYNRRGMKLLSRELTEDAIKSGEAVTVICADIDNLKPINDKFGHEEGDNAILVTAMALKKSLPSDSICVRTGGDEYVVILRGKDEQTVIAAIKAVHEYLDEYNAVSGLPYQIGCSCGYATAMLKNKFGLDNLMNTADVNMYKIKTNKKVGRI